MTGELLLELLSEEIPARMQRRAIEELTGLIRDKLAAADIPAATIEGHVTPRRLTVIADGIPARQPDRSEERRGPRVGAPEAAIGGFLRGAGLQSIDQCEIRGSDRGEFYFAVIQQPGRATAEVLPDLIHAAMTALSWPKSMRYPASNLRWVRPLNSVICLFDGTVLNLPLGEVPVGRVTRGHRFLSPGEISVANAADYREKLAQAHVVLDWGERRRIIARDLDKLASAEGLTVKDDQGLLHEVTGLVECPVVLMGSIDADFVRPLPDGLPPEVLATAMRTHQKYFSCLNPDGTPAPRFLFVANNLTPDDGKTIAAGNERVLRARLSDARFFWDQDRKVALKERIDSLEQRVFYAELERLREGAGSVLDKSFRISKIAEFIAPLIGADADLVRRTAKLSKADLSTGLVGEFPELQGIMGRYYALYGAGQPEDPRVADAIAEHYKPLGPNDTCSRTPESVAVALADKLDTLMAFFAAGERPTGSRDPFALRRAALGVVRLILENRLRIGVTPILEEAETCLVAKQVGDLLAGEPVRPPLPPGLDSDVLNFITERLRVHLREQGFSHDQVSAVFARFGVGIEDDLVRVHDCLIALKAFLSSDDGANLLRAYRRAASIVVIEETRDDCSYEHPADTKLFEQSEEHALYSRLAGLAATLPTFFQENAFDRAMAALATLREPVDEFFDKVTVNVNDPKLRENRLRLLARIRATMNQVADFSQIEG